MKYKSNAFLAALAISGGILSTPFARATDFLWGTNTSGGSWDWNTDSNWADEMAPMFDTERADLQVDWTGANVIDLSEATTINGILFDDTGDDPDVGVTIGNGGNPANILTLAGTTPAIDVNTGNTLTISAVMAGSIGWNKKGAGALILSGANSAMTAGIDVQGGGVLSVSEIADTGGNSQIGNYTSGQNPWLGVNGGIFRYTGTATASTARKLWMMDANGTFDITEATGSLALTGTVGGVARRVTKTGAGTLSFSQAITGANGGVTVNAGTFTLTNTANTYTGNTIISGGTLDLTTGKIFTSGKNGANSLVISGGGTLVGSNWEWAGTLGGLQYNTGNISVNNGTIRNVAVADAAFQGRGVAVGADGITYENATASTTWTINNGISASFYNSYVTDAPIQLTGAGNGSFQQVISGTGVSVTKSGAGTWTLTHANTYTGNTVVENGTLVLADDARLTFLIAATTGENNRISGTTATLAGDFNIDTSLVDASSLSTGSWTLENVASLTGAYEASFQVVSGSTLWTAAGDQWTTTVGSRTYSFDETTGILTLTSTAGYDSWIAGKGLAGADADFDADPDHDGVNNGLEFVLGGEPNPANPGANSNSLLPTVSQTGGNLVFEFKRKDISESDIGLVFQWSTDLSFPSPANDVPVTAVDSTTDTITVDVTEDAPDSDTDTIVITVPAAKAAAGKLFGRLRAIKTP